ncbi:MAG: type IV pilus twitching motility protein PilT [Candidatus Orphnella occulta]|nr:type IV pilus twitching motility protein PilT [Candidatus Orphnella occulta]MDP8297697.1 type IV pilus twitching motility protein PilT [Candidatus Orphnella occulta]
MASIDIKELLQYAVDKDASDLHLTEGVPPTLRIDGALQHTTYPVLTRDESKKAIYSILNDDQKVRFETELELDMSLYIPDLSRFRVNVHMQRGSVEAAFRVIPSRIKTTEELGLPPIVADLARKPNGLVLATGPTGMGKSTTLSAMVDIVNSERQSLIISIEDPIEYVHKNKKSIIKQREVGSDTKSFTSALKHALRQDPDVILVGEMRDLETISTAVTAAETGHLVLSTLHTPDAPQTIDRLIDIFPPHQQKQIMIQLAGCLQGVICQQLLPRKDNNGRVVACEVMTGTPAVRSLIREQKTEQLATVIQTNAQHGMITMDKTLKKLYDDGIIDEEVLKFRTKNKGEFDNL